MDKMSFKELVNEIVEFTGLDEEIVKEKVWKEALSPGWNVKGDAIKFDVDFHIYNKKMENFYKESDGFIFETSVESHRRGKQCVLKTIESRIRNHLDHKNQKIKILMLGDGVGHDTTYMHNRFPAAEFFYFDVPGSKTYNFAMKKFQKNKVQINLIDDYDKIPYDFFDVIICLEVLEHLPNPLEAMKNIYKFLKMNGILLITESFGNVSSNFPTHLKSNIKYSGKTPFIFYKNGLILNYYCKERLLFFRPTEYVKRKKSLKYKLNFYLDKHIIVPFVFNSIRNIGR